MKSKIRYREVLFDVMLKCDGEVICDCWLLSNSINKYGVDLTKPTMFNELLKQIGTHLTSMNCSSLFEQAKWYVIDDGIQPDFFFEDENNKPKCKHTTKMGFDAIAYDSSYEMRSSDIHCSICGKKGSREELEKDRL